MKVIFIYGPPATGKLTVAQELQKLTNYKIMHNHLAGDFVSSVIKFNSKAFKDFSIKIRLDLFELAAKQKIKGIISTFVYSPGIGDVFIKKLIKVLSKYKSEIFFVHLTCDKKELEKRVRETSRKKYKKVNKINDLKNWLKKYDFYKPITYVESLQIDNTKMTPKKVAEKIKMHLSKP